MQSVVQSLHVVNHVTPFRLAEHCCTAPPMQCETFSAEHCMSFVAKAKTFLHVQKRQPNLRCLFAGSLNQYGNYRQQRVIPQRHLNGFV